MKKIGTALVCFSLVVAPLYAAAPSEGRSATAPPSLLETAEIAAASGAYRPQNTSTLTTGRIREDDKRRSAIALAISGAAALTGAALWRWVPCRNVSRESTNLTERSGYFKCYTQDGQRKGLETPTKAMLGAGIGLEFVSLFYLIAHLRQDKN